MERTDHIKVTVFLLSVLLNLHYLDGRKLNPFVGDITMVEDAIGTYELESLKKLILKSESRLQDSINQLGEKINHSSTEKEWTKKADANALELKETVNNLQSSLDGTRGYIEEVYEGIKKSIQTFKNQFSQNLSNLKLLVEHQTNQFQSVLGRTNLASQQVLASDCLDLYNLRYNASGTYWINKLGVRVLCDMETEGGGWLVIQRRAKVDYQVNFSQNWFTYKMGFGNLDTEFWIGNDVLHMLTNQKPYELMIEMEDFENGTFYATYSNFRVGNEESSYALDIGNYSGNASDAFSYHHGRPFSTYDRDQDNFDDGNCANYFSGGWWYDRCYDAHLNGIYPDPPDRKNASYISWWARNNEMEKVPLVLTSVMIKIRPYTG